MDKDKEEYQKYLADFEKNNSGNADPKDYVGDSMAAQEEFQNAQDSSYRDLMLLGAHGASQGFLDEGAGAVKAMTGGNYTEGRNAAREEISGARERQGLLGTGAEVVGNIGASMAIPALRGGTILKEAALGAIHGAGEAPEMSDIPAEAGVGAVVGGASQAVLGGISNKVFGAPKDILARTAGARGINFKNAGGREIRDPAEVANRAAKLGFFNRGDLIMDATKGKFVPANSGVKQSVENFVQPLSLEQLIERTNQAKSVLSSKNDELLKNKTVTVGDLHTALRGAMDEFIPAGEGVAGRKSTMDKVIYDIFGDLDWRHGFTSPKGLGQKIPAEQIEIAKRNLQNTVSKSYEKEGLDTVTSEGIGARRLVATKLDKMLDKLGGIDYAKNNDKMHDMFNLEELLHNKSSRMRGAGVEGAHLTRPSMIDQAKDVIDSPTLGVTRYKTGMNLENPSSATSAIKRGIIRTPGEMFLQNNENVINQGRTPQSEPNLSEDLIRTPLPRTTDGLMKNKNFVLMKIAQMAPEMLEAVKDTYDHDPEMLSQLAPVIAQKMPQFFQRDRYNRFDGRILSEQDKAKAIKDTLSNPNLSTIQQAQKITTLTKDGIFEG